MDLIMFVVVLGTSIWVLFDAKSNGVRKGLVSGLADMSPGGWCAACLLLWIIVFPLYLVKRGQLKQAAQSAQPTPAS
jgi:hypothetical protein